MLCYVMLCYVIWLFVKRLSQKAIQRRSQRDRLVKIKVMIITFMHHALQVLDPLVAYLEGLRVQTPRLIRSCYINA